MNYTVSVDKVVITAFDRGDMSSKISELFPLISKEEGNNYSKETGELYGNSYITLSYGAKYPYRKSFSCRDGSLIQWTDVKDMRDYRIEFNPNNCELNNIKKLLGCLKYPNVTRIDIAFDFPDLDLNNYKIIDSFSRKKRKYISGLGRLETLYIGSTSSDMVIRMYDKRQEREDKKKDSSGYGWRIESQMRKTWVSGINDKNEGIFPIPNPFQGLTINKNDYCNIENIQQKAMLFYLENHPHEWENLAKPTRLKYKKMLTNNKDCEQLDLENIFDKEKRDILYYIHKLLKISKKNNVIREKSVDHWEVVREDLPEIDRPVQFTKIEWDKLTDEEKQKYKN